MIKTRRRKVSNGRHLAVQTLNGVSLTISLPVAKLQEKCEPRLFIDDVSNNSRGNASTGSLT